MPRTTTTSGSTITKAELREVYRQFKMIYHGIAWLRGYSDIDLENPYNKRLNDEARVLITQARNLNTTLVKHVDQDLLSS